ncbi:MAG: hypothetical protein GY856_11885 [bacterium]|nr:hypothetical protein [bacterium]
MQSSLDLGRGPLTRLVLLDNGPEAGARLLWVIHHLAVDGVSWRILLEDLESVYRQLERGEPISLPPRTTSFRSWAVALTERAGSPELTEELEFWRRQAEQDASDLGVDHPGGSNTLASARTVSVRLPAEETRALLDDVHRAYRTRINDLLLAALAQAVGRFRGTGTLLLDLEGHGREPLAEAVDLSRTVGWFTTLYPVLLECLDDAGEQIKTVKERLRAVPAGGIGYGLLRYLNPETAERLREQPAASLVFNYLGAGRNGWTRGSAWSIPTAPPKLPSSPPAGPWRATATSSAGCPSAARSTAPAPMSWIRGWSRCRPACRASSPSAATAWPAAIWGVRP